VQLLEITRARTKGWASGVRHVRCAPIAPSRVSAFSKSSITVGAEPETAPGMVPTEGLSGPWILGGLYRLPPAERKDGGLPSVVAIFQLEIH